MTAKPRQSQVLDEYDRPVPGAEIYVTDTLTLGNAQLTIDGSVPLSQPVTTDEFGFYTYFANDGIYREDIYFAGKLRYQSLAFVGTPPQLKGDPGANTGGIGLFSVLSALNISTDSFWTSGFNTLGLGAAFYCEDASLNDDDVAANPRWAAKSANGGYFRLDITCGIYLPQVGGLPNCTAVGVGTDNAIAINAAIAAGAFKNDSIEIIVPKTSLGFRVASAIKYTSGVKLRGGGFHENPGLVNGVTYTAPQGLAGSMLVFDENVAGLQFIDFTDNAANAVAYEFQSSRNSVVEDLRLFSGGGNDPTKPGIEVRTKVNFRNVTIQGFPGNGLTVVANTAGSGLYGNASESNFDSVACLSNGCHGAQISGIDANNMTFGVCQFRDNGGWGALDQTHIGGNSYPGSQFSDNNRSFGTGTPQMTKVQADSPILAASIDNGSICFDNTSNTPHVLPWVYVEGGNGRIAHLPAGCLVMGGILSNAGSWTATSAPMVLDPSAGGKLICDTLAAHSSAAGLSLSASDLLLDSGHVIKVAGQQVLGGRTVGCPGAAVDLPTMLTLGNYIRDKLLNAHGLLGV